MKIALIVLALASATAQAGDEDFKRLPGYVDLDLIQIPKGIEEDFDVGPEPDCLHYALGIEDSDIPSGFLDGVASARVRSFAAPESQCESIWSNISDLRDRLYRDGWEQLIPVHDGEPALLVDIKRDATRVVGLLAVVVEPGGRATFMNLAGDLNRRPILSLLLGLQQGEAGDLLHRTRDH